MPAAPSPNVTSGGPSKLPAAYGASHAGVEAFCRALRMELAPDGIGVGVAFLDAVDTGTALEQLMRCLPRPLGRRLPVNEAAAAVVRGIERRSSHIHAPGRTVAVVGLRSHLEALDPLVRRYAPLARFVWGER